ncbi:MAG: response regulator [Armatimonadota bacterium]|nr:response regulator [Armatimonadota bacterium]
MREKKGTAAGRAGPTARRGTVVETDRSFAIVGIGASAGGLEAFTALLKGLPLDTGMAFVLVQHLDPDHESALTQILSRSTSLPVQEIADKQKVEPNHVYIIPRDTGLSISRGVLMLSRRQKTGPHRPIDAFFESLASDQGEGAIGVVLSGTATDGTLGLEAIRAEGGITFAQDGTAKHDSMPRSAIAAGVVDLVLSPRDIAKELARIASHPYGTGGPVNVEENARAEATTHEDDQTALPSGGHPKGKHAPTGAAEEMPAKGHEGEENGFKKIMLLLRNHSGVDFSLYKSTTIRRRITRRVVLTKHETPAEYAAFLRGNASELDSLYSDVLISVTSFFRNTEAFESLQSEVFPNLLEERSDKPLRCWVLGCSTGQEAYSIAMAFMETAEKTSSQRKLQIFATDLNDKLLEKARQGLYATTLAEDVSAERLRRFFVEEKGGYRIKKNLRQMVVFARQNLISDPPFSRMDLISCRNLLIYLEPTLQKKAIPTFHYALRAGGFLLLGASESTGGFTDLFEAVDKKHKIYRRKPGPSPRLHLTRERESGGYERDEATPVRIAQTEPAERAHDELGIQREADRMTINHFSPPGLVISDDFQVLQFLGSTGAFLEPPIGKASFNVLKMAREGLMLPLRATIERARKEGKLARRENVRFKKDGDERDVSLHVIPLKNLDEPGFLIFFEDVGKTRRSSPEPEKPRLTKVEERGRINELETELAEMRAYFQAAQEENEAANEELQAGNEEIQSANEELQSVNEELETSKEELESGNEELITVNEEMSNRNTELNRLNSDLINFQNAVDVPVVLLGPKHDIRRFNPHAATQFDLLATDAGRPISQIQHNLTLVSEAGEGSPLDVERVVSEVVASLHNQEYEVRDKAGRWHSLRVRPYLTLDNEVDGAVLALIDVDFVKRSEQDAAHLKMLNLENQKLESLGLLAGGIAHDFNNLLTPILGASELVSEMEGVPARAKPLMESISTACMRAADLTRQILAYAGKGRFFIEPTDLSSLVMEITDLIRVSVPKNVRIDLELQEHLPAVMCDRSQLQQVIMNLVINAAESTPEGRQAAISVSTTIEKVKENSSGQAHSPVEPKPGTYVVFSVTDSGGGMDAKILSQIFEPFFSTKANGRGLGLSAVLGIVRGHNGGLRVHTSRGAGTTFEALFPIAEPGASAAPADQIPHKRPAPQKSVGAILVVDDEEIVRKVVVASLKRHGFKVLTAANGVEGVKAFEKASDKISKVLLDLTMPVMNGHEVLKRLRAIRADVPIVIMSGYTEQEAIRHFGENDEVVFLQKPFTISDLMKKLGLRSVKS